MGASKERIEAGARAIIAKRKDERDKLAAQEARLTSGSWSTSKGGRGLKEARTAHCQSLMLSLEWRHTDAERLAKAWGIGLSTMQRIAAEASRRVTAEVTDPERVTQTVCAALDRVIREGLEAGDRRNVINAAATWAKILGVYKGLQDRAQVQVHAYAVQSIALPEVATPRPVRALEPAGQGVAQQSSAGELGAGESSAGESS